MFLGHAAAQRDVLARFVEFIPVPVHGQGPQHDVGAAARLFRHADLRTVDRAHHDVQYVSGGEIVDLPVERPE